MIGLRKANYPRTPPATSKGSFSIPLANYILGREYNFKTPIAKLEVERA